MHVYVYKHTYIICLAYLLEHVGAGVVLLGPADVEKDRRECLDRVGVAARHEVGEPDVVEGGDVARSHLGEQPLGVEVDALPVTYQNETDQT